MKNFKFQPSLFFIFVLLGSVCVNAQRGEPRDDSDSPQVPVIGIISTAGHSDDSDSIIPASYSEFVEAGGAKVVPIPWDLDEDRFNLLIESVNGVLFTGGEANLFEEDNSKDKKRGGSRGKKFSQYQERLASVVDIVIQKKKDGVHFPLWASGQGFESVGLALTNDVNLLDNYQNEGTLGPLYFTAEAKNSVMFQNFTQSSFDFLQNNSALYYDNEYGLNTSVPSLHSVFKNDKWIVTGTGKDSNSKEFLAAMESKKYPIYMVMFHPERVLYEGNHDTTSTLPAGVILTVKLMAKSFVAEAKKNKNKFENMELLNALLIENFQTRGEGQEIYYTFDRRSVDEKWNAVEGSYGVFIIIIVVILLIVGGFFGYNKYRQRQGMPEITYRSFVDGFELRPRNDNNNNNNNNNQARESRDVFI